MNPKFYQMLGLAMRAGKVISGEEPVLAAIRSGQAKLVIVADDGSENTKKKIKDKSNYYGISLCIVPSREQLGTSIGKSDRVIVGVVDNGFAKQLMKHYVT